MPIKFEFQKSISNLFSYHFILTQRTLVHAQWQDFISDPTIDDVPDEFFFGWILREETAVYLGFAWALSKNLKCYVIPNFYRDDAAKNTGIPYESINWEYEVEIKALSNVVTDKGFLPVPKPIEPNSHPSEWEVMSQHKKGGVFSVKNFTELAKIHDATLMDAFSEISVFCLKENRQKDLVTFLSSAERPDLSKFLKEDELFIDIVLIIDEIGSPDSILIKSSNDLSTKIHTISEQFEQAVSEYEQDSIQFKTAKQALFRIQDLAHGKTTNNWSEKKRA